MFEVKHNPHCAYQINYHPSAGSGHRLVWIPRYRKKVLQEPVAERLRAICAEIATELGFAVPAGRQEVLALEVLPDHVHLFVSCPPPWSPADVVRRFKGRSSRLLMQEFPQLRRQYWGGRTLWAEGYYVGTACLQVGRQAGHVSAETIRRYIEESQGT